MAAFYSEIKPQMEWEEEDNKGDVQIQFTQN